jgi:ribosomal protein L14
MFRAGILAGVVAVAGCGNAVQLKVLKSAEVEKLLKGNTIEGIIVQQSRPFKQHFGTNGITVQMAGNKRIGKWYVDGNNELCILWNDTQTPETMAKETKTQSGGNVADKTGNERCFSVKQDSQGKYRIYSPELGYVASVKRIIPGNPEKL